MNKLEKLIQKLCPDGLPISTIGDLITQNKEKNKHNTEITQVYVVSSTRGLIRAEEYRENTIHSSDTSNYTVVRKNMYAYNPARLNIGSIGRLKSEDGLVSPMYIVFKINEDRVRLDYFDYLIKSSNVQSQISSKVEQGARFRFDFEKWKLIKVQIPPLEIQDEVVSILNILSGMVENLNHEITYRQKQYNHYLDKFFGESIDSLDSNYGKITTLSSIGTLQRGKRFVHADACKNGVPCIHYGELYTHYGPFAHRVVSHIREDLRPKMRYANKNDVIIVGAGENKIDIGIGVAWLGDEPVAVHDACYTFKTGENPKYISYYLRSKLYHNQIFGLVSEGKICSISAESIGRSIICIPSLDEQEKVVKILDEFDSLLRDEEKGIPAELKYREKQFEYYQNKLLEFQSKED